MALFTSNKDKLILIWTNFKLSFHYDSNVHSVVDVTDGNISEIISEACSILKFKGKVVHVYYDGKYVDHKEIECPPISTDSDFKLYLDQMVKRGKIKHQFNEMVYIYTQSLTKRKNSALVDVFCKSFFREVKKSFNSNKIHVNMFSSMMPLLSGLVKRATIKDEPVVILGAFNGGESVVYMYYDQESSAIALCRYTPPYLGFSDVADEINNSVTYGKQIFSGSAPTVMSVGDYFNDMDVVLDLVDYKYMGGDDLLIESAFSFDIHTSMNAIHSSKRNIHMKRAYRRVAYLSSTIFLGLAITANVLFERAVVDLDANIVTEQRLNDVKRDIERNMQTLKDRGIKNAKILIPNDYRVYKIIRNIANDHNFKNIVLNEIKTYSKSGRIFLFIRGHVTVNPKEAAAVLSEFQNKLIEDSKIRISTSWTKNWIDSIERWRNLVYATNGGVAHIPFDIAGSIELKNVR